MWRSALPQVQVVDGPPTKDLPGDVLIVGFTPEDLSMSAVAQIADLRGGSTEQFTVYSVIRCWTAGADIGPPRRQCYQILRVAQDRLVANPTLDGAVARARYGGHTYAPTRNGEGQLIVDVVFSTVVDIFT